MKTIPYLGVNENYEPVRDWHFGVLSGHRLRVITYLVLGIFLLYQLQSLIWRDGSSPHNFYEFIWSLGSLLWVAPSIFGIFGIIGLLLYRHPKHLDKVEPINRLVVWRIVSRGTNVEALTSTIRRCQTEMAKTPLFPYLIEVVTDTHHIRLPEPNSDIRYLVVPKDFKTPNGTLYKARALQYALLHSSTPDDAWIVHLDEETQPTPSSIKGICAMIHEEEASGALRIGQGAILYHRKWSKYPFLTLADNVRTGVDFAQFHLQHRLGITFFGLHGSYIVVRNDVEKSIGFDFGPEGSITEDAFWGLMAMEKGYRCRWVEGYLEEQSTQSIRDFVRQRRRWMQGLRKVALYAPVSLKWRVSFGFNVIIWNLGPFATVYTFVHFFYGFRPEWLILFLANFSYTASMLVYLIGLEANLNEYGITTWWKRFGWFATQVLLLPVFSTMESAGVLAAFIRPQPGFHVVKK